MFWEWQRTRFPYSLCDVGGPVVPFDYDNLFGPNVTLSFEVQLGKLGKPVTLESLLNYQGEVVCYDYED